ncbi:Chromo (CHRromatin Organization MOdifier) domain [Rhizoctonia solani]|uniref:Chromo (CHRromatin Organization MOdifier) domain n=1 Tax=Rhizoctonia solani TaxID=456999 RepID=A0A8H7M2C4_9AGAM|nr:Chromo (CHRromatin Organization MOdifier) domain [Rhizoctonia solani]
MGTFTHAKQHPTDVPKADNLATQMELQWREIEAALRQSKTRMTAGETGEPVNFEVGEEAWLDAKNVKLKTLSPKLTEQRLGPFKITKKISDAHTAWNSHLKRDKKRAFENRPPPVTVDGEEEYEVEGITDMEKRGEYLGTKGKPQKRRKNPEKFEKEMKEKALGAAKALRGGAVS